MSSGLALYEARIDYVELVDGVANVHFSHACIHKSPGKPGRGPETSWSQAARLILLEARAASPLPSLPNHVVDGFLEVGGLRQEQLPLPYKRKVAARLWLRLADGAELEIEGQRPVVELEGQPIRLEDG
jgi:hypothetical protein